MPSHKTLAARLLLRLITWCAAAVVCFAHIGIAAQPSLIELADANGCKLYSSFGSTVRTITLGRVSGASCVNGFFQGPAIYGVSWINVRQDGTSLSRRAVMAGVLLDGRPDGLQLHLVPNAGVYIIGGVPIGVPLGPNSFFSDAGHTYFPLNDVKAGIDAQALNAGGRSPTDTAYYLKSVAERWATQREQLLQLVQSSNPEVMNPNWVGSSSPAPIPAADDPKVMGGGARPR